MTHTNNTTKLNKKGSHLSYEEMVKIETYKDLGYSNRKIAKILGRAHQTINNAINKGTVTQKRQIKQKEKTYEYYDNKYFASLNYQKYLANRTSCGRKPYWLKCEEFLNWAEIKVLNNKWSMDVCVGYAKKNQLFDLKIPSTKSLYNWIEKGVLKIKNIDLLEKIKRKPKTTKKTHRKNKMKLGKSIELRPKHIESREEFGHWEIDTVIGNKKKEDPVLLTLVERKTRYEMIIKIANKTSESVKKALNFLTEKTKEREAVFKTVTSDNGLEFSTLSEICEYVEVYFCHPFTSCERGTSENQHKLIRKYIPKGKSIDKISQEQIRRILEWMNNYPRKILNYSTPYEEFIKEAKALKIFA